MYEKSCGAVVFKRENGSFRVLVEKMRRGHYSIPKGHVEGSETEEETAVREIREETGLDAAVDTGFRKVITYSPFEGIIKDVVYFAAEVKGGDLANQETEIAELLFLGEAEALALLTYDSDRDVLREACAYIRRKTNGKKSF